STRVGIVFLPKGFRTDGGAFDLVVHFHGAPSVVEGALERANVNAVLLTVNLGVSSGPYEKAYATPGMLERVIAAVTATVERRANCTSPRVRRVALSAWSAGYGAVARLLAQPALAARVDAVLIADGMHAGYASVRTHAIDDAKMEPFVRFAERAAAGETLM